MSSSKALTVRRPWAQLIIAGAKTIENRTWTTDYRGPVFIHAGNAWDNTGATLGAQHGYELADQDTPTGYLGVVRLVDVHPANGCCAPWGEPAGFHWVLADPDRFDTALPGRGQLGLFPVPSDVLDAMAAR